MVLPVVVVNVALGKDDDDNSDGGKGTGDDQNLDKVPVLLERGIMRRGGDGNGFVVVLVRDGAGAGGSADIGIGVLGSTLGISVVLWRLLWRLRSIVVVALVSLLSSTSPPSPS